MNQDKDVCCYLTHLLLKYAQKKNIPNVTEGVGVPLAVLNNPHEWTSASTWTAIARNIERELGGGRQVIFNLAKELFLQDTNIFLPFLLRIAPVKILLKSFSNYSKKYSIKNIDVSLETDGKNRVLFKVTPRYPDRYSRQMCDFNLGATDAILSMRGFDHYSITEQTCATEGNNSQCLYLIEWTPVRGVIPAMVNFISSQVRDRNAIIQHLEKKHQELQQQYHEILSIRDFYSHIMESMGESIIWLNLDGRIDFTNNAFCKLVGKNESDVKGKPFTDFLPDAASAAAFSTTCTACRGNPGLQRETEFIFNGNAVGTRNGQATMIWVTREHFTPGYVISIRDITDKRKIERQLSAAEIRYRSLYENSPALIVALNLSGRFIYANPSMTEQSGFSEEELKSMHFKELIAPQADFDVDRLLQNLLALPTRLQEVHFKTKQGIWKCIALNTYHIHDSDGTLAGIAGIGIDITETKRLNEQIIKSQRMDLLGQLAGGMAHDFGNILTSINGFSKLITSKSTDEKIISYAESIGRSGVRAHDLVKNLLAFSRGDARRSVVFDVKSIAQEVKEMMFGAISKSIEIVAVFPDEPLFILGDPGNIHQCILNLCVNARDAIGQKSGTITMQVKKAGNGGNRVQVQVADTGCGIPPDIIEKIFDPFFSTKEKKEGTGLGLSVVYGIMKSHKGEISVESHPGEGAMFTLEFPVAPPPPQ